MTALSARVMRLHAAAWRLRRQAPMPCGLPFALVLMTDERRQHDIVALLEDLPPAGAMPPLLILFRHYGLEGEVRRGLAQKAAAAVRRRGHVFSLAGGGMAGAGSHNPSAPEEGWPVSVSVHSLQEAAAKRALRPDLGLVSPVFATKSHAGAEGLGPARAARLAAALPYPAFALGGMTALTAGRLAGSAFQGLAAIGAWSEGG